MTANSSTVLLKDWDVPLSTVQNIVPLFNDLQVRFAELPTDVSTILEKDKKDIKVMPKALQILTSHCKSWLDLFKKKQTDFDSQTQALPQSQVSLLLQTISSDVFKVLHDTQTLLSSEQKLLQPSDYTQAVNNMIGVIYTIHFVSTRYANFSVESHSSSGFGAQSAFEEIIGLFPDYDKRVCEIGL